MNITALSPLLDQTWVKKANEKVTTDLKRWNYWAFKTIEFKIVSIPYYTNKFSDYFYWYFGTILLIFYLSRIWLVSLSFAMLVVLHSAQCTFKEGEIYFVTYGKSSFSLILSLLIQHRTLLRYHLYNKTRHSYIYVCCV